MAFDQWWIGFLIFYHLEDIVLYGTPIVVTCITISTPSMLNRGTYDRNVIPKLSREECSPILCLAQARTQFFQCHDDFVFTDLRQEATVHFVYHHCLKLSTTSLMGISNGKYICFKITLPQLGKDIWENVPVIYIKDINHVLSVQNSIFSVLN